MERQTVFDPMRDVPRDDDQVERALRYERDEFVGDCLTKIYQCRRARGESLLDAYEATLLTHVEP